jgi:dephospho-CoA kinase
MNEKMTQNECFIIGLTGKIGTGKSLVRKMLGHLGAFGIDADALARETLKSDSTTISEIVRRFGSDVVNKSGKLDRAKIAQIVFKDEQSLLDLEHILHPLVTKTTARLIQIARLPIIVIEAIKLLESDLADLCDTIWVVDANEAVIFDRLASNRGMDRGQIIDRLSNQSSAQELKDQADMVIKNNKDILSTWHSVHSAWKNLENTNSSFSNCVCKTNNLISVYRKELMLHEDKFISILRNLFTKENSSLKPLKWFEEKFQSHNSFQGQSSIIHMSLNKFIFSSQYFNENKSFVVCDLTQFNLTMCGFFFSNPLSFESVFPSTFKAIENFSRLHMVQHIRIPINNLLKERISILRELGYNLLPAGDEEFQPRDKAGYNLYQKNISENTNIFSGK